MVNFYSGVSGARGKNPVGVVIHNDAGSQAANVAFYRNWLPTHNAVNGFAHYYIANDGVFQAENEGNMAWHTANAVGNVNYIGIEACQSMGNKDIFMANEQACFKLAAEILQRYGLEANQTTVMLHREFVATSCPHRSWELHGAALAGVKNYYIQEIKKYMSGSSEPKPSNPLTAGAYYPVKDVGLSKGHLDKFGLSGGKLVATGWHIGNYDYEYIFVMDYKTGKELARVKAPSKNRPDVAKMYSTSSGTGFDVSFDAKKFKGRTIYIMARCTNDATGNTRKGSSDLRFNEWYLTIPK
ncbi:peptidoglycan recognition protein family protein [Enterococcus sp. LJL128]